MGVVLFQTPSAGGCPRRRRRVAPAPRGAPLTDPLSAALRGRTVRGGPRPGRGPQRPRGLGHAEPRPHSPDLPVLSLLCLLGKHERSKKRFPEAFAPLPGTRGRDPADRAPHAPPRVPLRAVAVGGARSPKHLAQVRCSGAGENVPLSHSVYPHVRTFKTHKRSHKQTLPFLFF